MRAFSRLEVMGNTESADNISVKSLRLLLLSCCLFTVLETVHSESNSSHIYSSSCYRPPVMLDTMRGLGSFWQTSRKGCLVEEILERRMREEEEKSPNGVTSEQAARVQREVQAEVCACLDQKGPWQRKQYRWRGNNKKNSWMDDLVWKRMGDHFKGRLYEQFNKMLQLDVLLKRGDINENYMIYAPKCRVKAVTEQLASMRGKSGNGYNCSNNKLFNKRLKLILGTKNLGQFEKDLEGNLRKVVENKISRPGQCLTYKSYLASQSPSPLRFEILDIIKQINSQHPAGSQGRREALSKVHQFYYQNYAKIKPGTSNNPLYNEAYLNMILGEDALRTTYREQQGQRLQEGYTSDRKSHERNMRELQGDPFLKSLLNDPDFFMNFADSESPELAFHDSDNIKKVFEDQNEECSKLSSPEFLGRMFCDPKLPPLDTHLIVNDISPESSVNGKGENYFKFKINEYMASRHLCFERRKGKNMWMRKDQDFQNDNLIHEVLAPKSRLVSELETLALKASGDPRLQNEQTAFEKLNQRMCPLIPGECKGTNMTGTNCNNIEAVLGSEQSLAYLTSRLKSIKINGQPLNDQDKNIIMSRVQDLLESIKDPFTMAEGIEGQLPEGSINNLKSKLKELLTQAYGEIIERKTGASLGRPINQYDSRFMAVVSPGDFYEQINTLVQGHAISNGKGPTIDAQRLAAIIDSHKEGIQEYYANLPEESRRTITRTTDITSEMLTTYLATQNTTVEDEHRRFRETAPQDSGLARLFDDDTTQPIVTNTAGSTGSNYFTDYFLAASEAEENSLSTFREGMNPSDEAELTSRAWAPLVGPSRPGSDGAVTVEQGIPYSRQLNTTAPVPTIARGGDNRSGNDEFISGIPSFADGTPPLGSSVPLPTSGIGRDPIESGDRTVTDTFSGTPIISNGTSASPALSRGPASFQETEDEVIESSPQGTYKTLNSFTPPSQNDRIPRSDDELDELRDLVGDARREQDRRLIANQGIDRANNMMGANLSNIGGPSYASAKGNGTEYPEYRAPAGTSYVNPYTSSDGAGRLPSDIEGRIATGSNGLTPSASSEKEASGASVGGASKGKSTEAGSDTVANGVTNLGKVPAIPGFEGESVSNCAIPTLIYTVQCYFPQTVFNTWSYLDEFSSDEEKASAYQHPRGFVSELGLEGKAFVVVREIPKDEEGGERLLVTTYDYFPPMLEDVEKMSDEKFRNDLISKILSERWNFMAMREYANNTKVLEEKVYSKNDFVKITEERQLKPMIASVAEELYQNVSKMNLRIKKENQLKVKALQRDIASKK